MGKHARGSQWEKDLEAGGLKMVEVVVEQEATAEVVVAMVGKLKWPGWHWEARQKSYKVLQVSQEWALC